MWYYTLVQKDCYKSQIRYHVLFSAKGSRLIMYKHVCTNNLISAIFCTRNFVRMY